MITPAGLNNFVAGGAKAEFPPMLVFLNFNGAVDSLPVRPKAGAGNVIVICFHAELSLTVSGLSAPHFGPPASHTRISDRGPGHYSSPGNQRQIGEEHGLLRKAEESHRKNERTRNPRNDRAHTVALFITESPKHRKVPNMGLQKFLSMPK
ncbi:hypothetical protein CDL15_Pgr028288 [Punica granatum]|uniref:Uncharacterized protein n=1 Tax=Punica granatum TaxID=22663 RepID=A0A218VX99_PUNGR|nr:hypothetical protein CDL15_Pgr028288 [Punica granatum]